MLNQYFMEGHLIYVLIEGEHAHSEAQQLLDAPNVQGKIHENNDTPKAIDWGVVVEVIGNIGTVVGTVGGTVSLAHTIWKWRKEMKEGQKTVLSKRSGRFGRATVT